MQETGRTKGCCVYLNAGFNVSLEDGIFRRDRARLIGEVIMLRQTRRGKDCTLCKERGYAAGQVPVY